METGWSWERDDDERGSRGSDDREGYDDKDSNSGLNEFHAYYCAFCGEENEVFVDASGAAHQEFTEDCAICCRPNLISITIEHNGYVSIDVSQEYEA